MDLCTYFHCVEINMVCVRCQISTELCRLTEVFKNWLLIGMQDGHRITGKESRVATVGWIKFWENADSCAFNVHKNKKITKSFINIEIYCYRNQSNYLIIRCHLKQELIPLWLILVFMCVCQQICLLKKMRHCLVFSYNFNAEITFGLLSKLCNRLLYLGFMLAISSFHHFFQEAFCQE